MGKFRAYIRRLETEKLLGDLKPIDVPLGNVPRQLPKYIPKFELQKILSYLDDRVKIALEEESKEKKYNAFLYRALIRFLYTS